MNRSKLLRKKLASQVFSPEQLFADGGNGCWYDPYDLSTMFQDAAGTMQVTSDGDPVALWKDKSGNNNDVDASSTDPATFRTNGTLNWVELGDNNERLLTDNLGFPSRDSPTHQFAAIQNLASPPSNAGVMNINRTGGNNEQRAVGFQDDTTLKVDARGLAALAAIDSSQNKHVYEGYFSGSTIRGTVNNSTEDSVTGTINTTTDTFVLGQGITSDRVAHKNFGTIIVAYKLSDDQRTKIYRWLAEKAGI